MTPGTLRYNMLLVTITFQPKPEPALSRALLVIVALLAVSCGIGGAGRTSVWVENRSSETATFLVYDLSDGPAAWYMVPAHTTAHAGSDGLRFPAVVANVLGWGHEANHVSRCSPGDYDDTLYDVPPGASVRLLIEETGRPSVSFAPEPQGLPHLVQAPLGPMSEDQRCRYIDSHQ